MNHTNFITKKYLHFHGFQIILAEATSHHDDIAAYSATRRTSTSCFHDQSEFDDAGEFGNEFPTNKNVCTILTFIYTFLWTPLKYTKYTR